MKKARPRLLVSAALLVLLAAGGAQAAAPFKKVALATTGKATASTTATSTTAEAPTADSDEVKADNATVPAVASTKNSKLTGIPQIDYIWDPNLPRELHGYNLSSYPFFSNTPPPEDIHFKCDGLHDGFYAAIEFKCQVYHHCVYGIRHDFLCANFTAFDQKTFICHFVSDVDCEGSQKYWSRNDNLYMATTTTSTTTTTTEPPPTQRRRIVRPLRPLRRPFNQRPSDDYYYDGEEYEDDDYYEERVHRRRKQRPRQRKPALDYDDDYYEKDDTVSRRRPNSRDRFRDEDAPEQDDYDVGGGERRKYDRPRSRNNNRTVSPGDRRKAAGRKPLRGGGDERRSFGDDRLPGGRKDKTRPVVDEADEAPLDAVTQPRRLVGRRRINEKRSSSTPSAAVADLDDLDEYEKPRAHVADHDEAAADDETPSKQKTTPKPLDEFVTPKAAPASVYARPRAPPRISRPVPVNEKKKFQYPVQKTGTTAAPAAQSADDDYYDDEEYEDVRGGRRGSHHSRRRIVDDPIVGKAEEEEAPLTSRRRQQSDAAVFGRKPTRVTLRKPVTDKKPLPAVEDEDYDNTGSATSGERYDNRASGRRRPYAGRKRGGGVAANLARGNEDVDFVDDDYEERQVRPQQRQRPTASALIRKGAKKPLRPQVDEDEAESDAYEPVAEQPVRGRPVAALNGRRKSNAIPRLRQSSPTTTPIALVSSAEQEHDEFSKASAEVEQEEEVEETPSAPSKPITTTASGRPASVRVVKRPFLPSRGGSPYLPRGLQPVGPKAYSVSSAHTTDSAPLDMGSTISGVRLLEHGAPILRDSGAPERAEPRTTLPPRSSLPVAVARPEQPLPAPPQVKVTLDELYENDYDVTLNDALNPTLKPLSSLHANHHHHQQHLHQQHQQLPPNQPQQQQLGSRNYPSVFGSVPVSSSSSASASVTASSATSLSSDSSLSSSNAFVNNNQSPVLYHHQLNNNNNYMQQQQLQSHQTHAQALQQPSQQQHQLTYHQTMQASPHQNQNQNQNHHQHQLQLHASSPLHHQQHQQQQQQHQLQRQQQQQQQQQQSAINNYNSDSYFSSTDIRRRAIVAAPQPVSSRTDYRGPGLGTRIAQHFYDDFEY